MLIDLAERITVVYSVPSAGTNGQTGEILVEGDEIHSGEAGAGDDSVVVNCEKMTAIAGAVSVMGAVLVRDVMSSCCGGGGMRRFRWRGG